MFLTKSGGGYFLFLLKKVAADDSMKGNNIYMKSFARMGRDLGERMDMRALCSHLSLRSKKGGKYET